MAVLRLNELSACEIAHGVTAGRFTAESVARACLDRIEARDKQVKAWAFIDPEAGAESGARHRQKRNKGALAGVPLGIKDIIDTFDMPTDMGSPIYRNNRTAADASSVALARRAGAVILGKTVTCEFAGLTPNVTRNPHNLDHTPGGSSSGSAAAVADNMCAVGYGTQTGGSVLRPASFCGAVGYKPTYNLIARGGIKFAAESRDTIGLIARSVDDVDLVSSVLIARPLAARRDTPPKIGLCRTHLWDHALPESKHAVEDSAHRLGRGGREYSRRDAARKFQRARRSAHHRQSGRARALHGA